MVKVAYLDTSAALKLVLDERETNALLSYLESQADLVLVASWLLFTELQCAAGRRPLDVPEELVRQVLDPIELTDLSRHDLIAAAQHVPLRSADAIHLAVALRLEVHELITYDHELAAASSRLGLRAVSPGADHA